MSIPNWLDWARRLQSIAQSGMFYAKQFDRAFDEERYAQVERVAAEMIATSENGAVDAIVQLEDTFAPQAGHATPKIDVRGVVFQGNKILLVQEKLDHLRWTLPGGWADINDSASESTVREIWEETGYRARPLKLLALYDRNRHGHPPYLFHAYKAFFRCELTGEPRTIFEHNLESGEIGWFGEDEIAGLEMSVGRVTPVQIARFFEHLRHPDLPTDFD